LGKQGYQREVYWVFVHYLYYSAIVLIPQTG